MKSRFRRLPGYFCAALLAAGAGETGFAYVSFESPPIHAVDLSPDGKTLAVCNLADGRLEILDPSTSPPTLMGGVVTGVEPASVRFRSDNEAWVANTISGTVTVAQTDKRMVSSILHTAEGPSDIVFSADGRFVFVSCAGENVVEKWDAETKVRLASIPIKGSQPRALALAKDGGKVFAAVFESGNASTILAPGFSLPDRLPPPGPVEMKFGPQKGLNPAPNHGDVFEPAISTNIPASVPPPRVSLIVKKDATGRWLDDNAGDWTGMVSGTNSALSGRVEGWDMPDRDLAMIDTTSLEVTYVSGLMNLCMALAVNPISGNVAMVGSDARNELRFEPRLQSIFVTMKLALIEPVSGAKSLSDLNPHLDYALKSIPLAERLKTLGDPRGAVWSPDGGTLFVTGMGSDNIAAFDAAGVRLKSAAGIGEGPTSLIFDARRNRLRVFNRFSAELVSLDPQTLAVESRVRFFDPAPEVVKAGRRHFYNTTKSSGLGQASCASCHPDGKRDRLAWDLGNPAGDAKKITSANYNFARLRPASTNDFHPMKGPMVTQTLIDIIGHEPLHWRADRNSIQEFNPTFTDLQGADRQLTPGEMEEFKQFLRSLTIPPNRLRNIDNSLPQAVSLKGHVSLGRGRTFAGTQLPNGSPALGLNLFLSSSASGCIVCHTLPTGLGADMNFTGGSWRNIPLGTNGEHHVALVATNRSLNLPFKISPLRGLGAKMGMSLAEQESMSGFGFTHDGRVDTLTRFVQDGFNLQSDEETADIIAFLLCIQGGDLPPGQLTNPGRAPGLPGNDAAAGVGVQWLLTSPGVPSDLGRFITYLNSPTSRVDLVVRYVTNGAPKGWLYNRATRVFEGAHLNEKVSVTGLAALAKPAMPLAVMGFSPGVGVRMALDRDMDGFADEVEIEQHTDPDDEFSRPDRPLLRINQARLLPEGLELVWESSDGARYAVQTAPGPNGPWHDAAPPKIATGATTSAVMTNVAGIQESYFRLQQKAQP